MKYLKMIFFVTCSVILFTGFNVIPQGNLSVSPDELRSWVEYLASDAMRGRANGSPEMITAANWVADKFKEYDVIPLTSSGNYIYDYTFNSRQRTINEHNVIGMIKGRKSGLKDQYLVISAHFDHVGVRKGPQPDSIYNGADDNAAGTCALIGIAKTIKDLKLKPGRTLIFAAFSGEEMGMRGSHHFVSDPPVPLKNIWVDFNFEMIGHSEYLGKNNYYMTGCDFSNLDDIIREYNKNTGFHLIDTISMARNLFYASDNISFSRISVSNGVATGIPSGTFATTTMASYIHRPNDEARLFDFDNMANLVDYFSKLIIWLSQNKSELKWTDPQFTELK
jgi:Zn-dependent M28 family amino/carboxypeptidase